MTNPRHASAFVGAPHPAPYGGRRTAPLLAPLALAAALGLLFAAPAALAQERASRDGAPESLRTLDRRFREIAARAIPSTVLVKVTLTDGSGRTGFGSGAIVSEDGLILTCAHVIEVPGDVEVVLSDGDAYDAEVLGRNRRQDYALLKIEARGLQPFPLGDSRAVALGDWIVALGHPGGPFPDLRPAFSVGRVTGLHRRLPVQMADRYYDDAIRTDAPIFAGNSGGPLLNLRGELIGLNGAILLINENSYAVPMHEIVANFAALREGKTIEGRAARGGFAPLDEFEGDDLSRFLAKTARRLLGRDGLGKVLRGRGGAGDGLARALERFGRALEDGAHDDAIRDLLGAGGEPATPAPEPPPSRPAPPAPRPPRPYLGVTVAPRDATADIRGVLVEKVDPAGPAAGAGLEPGDVIVAAGGRAVERGADLAAALAPLAPGATLELRVLQLELEDGLAVARERELTVKLAARKEE